jgi:hypothetical protein
LQSDGALVSELPWQLRAWASASCAFDASLVLWCFRLRKNTMERCDACQEERPLQRCSLCKIARYCDEACQKSDFAEHKLWCRGASVALHCARCNFHVIAEAV